jgi:hypothetical protein
MDDNEDDDVRPQGDDSAVLVVNTGSDVVTTIGDTTVVDTAVTGVKAVVDSLPSRNSCFCLTKSRIKIELPGASGGRNGRTAKPALPIGGSVTNNRFAHAGVDELLLPVLLLLLLLGLLLVLLFAITLVGGVVTHLLSFLSGFNGDTNVVIDASGPSAYSLISIANNRKLNIVNTYKNDILFTVLRSVRYL